jgi:hypothetical protein
MQVRQSNVLNSLHKLHIVQEIAYSAGLSGALACQLDAAPAGCGPLEREYAVLLATQAMIIHEEFLELALERLPEIINSLYVSITMVAVFDRDDAVVALSFLFIALFALNYTDHPAGEFAAGKCRLVH